MTISAQKVTMVRDGRRLVDDVSLSIKAGRFTAVIGPNGAGKSSLLKLLSGEVAPDHGEVTFANRSLKGFSALELAAIRAVLPQSTHLSFPFTALEVVRMGAVAAGSFDPARAGRQALARVGLAGFENRRYNALSGGEQQRVQLARVLAQVPTPSDATGVRTLFLDEPTSSLDIGHQISVLEIARSFANEGGAVLAILHDLNLAAEFADDLVILHRGRVVASGTPADTLTDDVIADVYGLRGTVGRIPPAAIPFVLPQSRQISAG
ncbi:heme ABC transporter ATP-binding protein [Peteryoungia desertarenae]|uniref:Heme ABC transporter ATP-binding protein n=1 Tax=Peteryoungia desertarenae TaxID=1813451 RepID=A0ABX6QRF3_9HYPH|nr:heme ABC transporter ATP-binding protein [Peteryoungia desertarenae]QLF70770.1 heme ABC transporter ATP-binding protein [Peteryoungia desertarenae]